MVPPMIMIITAATMPIIHFFLDFISCLGSSELGLYALLSWIAVCSFSLGVSDACLKG